MNAVSDDTWQLAALLSHWGLVAAAPFGGETHDPLSGPEGIVLAAPGGAIVEVDLRTHRAAFAAWARRADRVFAFADAKAALKRLLSADVDVRRPLCRWTLETLARRHPSGPRAVPRTAGDARDEALGVLDGLSPLLDEVERDAQRGTARLECLVVRSFAALEARGLYVDVFRWKSLVDDAKTRAESAKEELFAALGDTVPRDLFGVPDLNLDADQDVKAVFERVLGRSLDDFNKHTLRSLEHPAAGALLAYREAKKIVSTYGDAFLEHVDDQSGRIHATFLPLGASTGRVASREPNLQNLPSDARFHECLRAPKGRALVTADYATCELRILADLSKDPVFLEAFENGEDLHSVVASRIFEKPVSKTENAELRARAKAINFGLVYGMGTQSLASAVGVSFDEADVLLKTYFKTFPRIKDHLEQSVDIALERGFCETALGRRLWFDKERLARPDARGELSRIAKNMPIQGTSADMTKLAMVLVHERMSSFDDAGLVNTIHDELVVECAADEGEAVGEAVREEMEAAHRTLLRQVPPLVEVHVGDTWHH